MQVIAHQGDSLDALLYRHLGTSDGLETIYADNPGLATLGPILPMGTRVTLPELASVQSRENTTLIQLWD